MEACIAADGASEYGSDFTPDEEDLLTGLLQAQPTVEASDNPIVNPEQVRDAEESREGLLCLRVFATVANESPHPQVSNNEGPHPQVSRPGQPSTNAHPQVSRPGQPSTNDEADTKHIERHRESSASIEAPLSPRTEELDLRSPIERFRSRPKTLSVTDLISPSWCELQYWYVLTKHGRKRRTLAMRQGSKVHQTLEDQVHVTVPVETKTKEDIGKLRGVKVPKVLADKLPKKIIDKVLVTVPVEVKTKEDNWALRLWNITQGLQTLRETGMTREIEVWGLLDGQLVNGVIDELSYVCPDRELEATAAEEEARPKSAGKNDAAIAPDQAAITEFFIPRRKVESAEESFARASRAGSYDKVAEPSSRIYISDVKTRGVRSLPKAASFKPTIIQLLLYHRLLGELAEGKFDANVLFGHHNLNKDLPFTESFVAQIGDFKQSDLPEQLGETTSATPEDLKEASQESVNTLRKHNSLAALWDFMMQEFRTTFPNGAKSLGPILKAEYRDPFSREVIGSKTILYEHEMLQKYLDDGLQWWRGARSARGVPIEEAFKCGNCEFAESCEWRANKIDDHVKQMRSRSQV